MACESSSRIDILEDIASSLAGLDMGAVKKGVDKALNASIPPSEIIKNGLGKGMEMVGQKYEKNEFFLSELIFSSAIMNEGMLLLEPHLGSDAPIATGKIIIGTGRKERNVWIKIRDSGKGIPSENFDRIFDPGFTTKGVRIGVGLGLSICYKIVVNEHHGHIDVVSEPGKGTKFTITLPKRFE